MFDEAFRFFQKKNVIPQNAVKSAVLLAIAGVYVQAVIKDSGNTLGYLLIIACIAVTLILWYNMFKLRRAVHEALKDVEKDIYNLTVCEDKLIIRTEDAPQPAEEPAEPEIPEEEPADGNGFQQLFPEKEAESEPVLPTEISLDGKIRIYEQETYFMVYIIRQNFYVIPKKDFSADEIAEMKKLFHLA
jgi:hypothetical protein